MAESSEPLPKPKQADKSPRGVHRLSQYKKNKVIPVDKLRSKREKEETQLRKDKRYEQLIKRRHLRAYEPEKSIEEIDDKKISEHTPLNQLAIIVKKCNGEKKLKAVTAIRKLLSGESHPPIDDIIETGVIPDLIDCISIEEDDKLQMEAAWALTNVAGGNSDQTASVVNGGCIPKFIQLMTSPTEFIREQVVWGITNISSDCREYRDTILEFGIVEVLEKMMENGKESLNIKREGACLLMSICRQKHLEKDIIASLLPVFSSGFLYHDDDKILGDLCWGLVHLTDDGQSSVLDQVLESGVLEYVIKMLDHDSRGIAHSAVKVIGNITTGNDVQTQYIIDQGGMVKLKGLLDYNKEAIQSEACWALSNITAGTQDQKQAVINNGIVPMLLDIVSDDERTIRVKKEAVCAITNITEGATNDQISCLVGLEIISKLSTALEIPHYSEILSRSLGGLAEILSRGEHLPDKEKRNGRNPYTLVIKESPGLVEKIKNLQSHQSADVCDKASSLIKTYITPLEKEEELDNVEEGKMNENKRLQKNQP